MKISKKNKYKIPFIGKIIKDRDNLLKERNNLARILILKQQNTITNENFSPGHFYSVIPDLKEVKKNEKHIFYNKKKLPGINLNEKEQIKFFKNISSYYKDLDFPKKKTKNKRFYYENDAFSYGDSIVLYSMIRHFKPKNIIEVGSGFSSCVTLDTNEK